MSLILIKDRDIDISKVKAPFCKVVFLKKFDLKKIKDKFPFAPFARKVLTGNVIKIKQKILLNEFVDIVIKVKVKLDGSYIVTDGQHRLTALAQLNEERDLFYYDLIVIEFYELDEREIQRNLNLGAPHTLRDHLKILDDGNVPFFNGTKRYCSHYFVPGKIIYTQTFRYLHYAKKNEQDVVVIRIDDIKDILQKIIKSDVVFINLFYSHALSLITDSQHTFYNPNVMSNVFRICFENNLNGDKMVKLITAIHNEKKYLHKLIEKRDPIAQKKIYSFIIDIVCPSINVRVIKGEF